MIDLSAYSRIKRPAAVLLASTLLGLPVLGPTVEAQTPDGASSPVPTVTVTRSNLQRTSTQPATVHAFYSASIFARTSGYLVELKADIGQSVKKGELLAVIDVPELARAREAKLADIARLEAEQQSIAAELRVAEASVASQAAKIERSKAELGSAEAQLKAAGIELGRAKDLVERGSVANRILDEATERHETAVADKAALQSAVEAMSAELQLAEAQCDAAEARVAVASASTDVARRELDELEERLAFAQITSPFNGVISQRNVELGDLVRNAQNGNQTNGRPLFVVSQVDRVRVRVPVPERDAPLANAGDDVSITLQALGSRVFQGKLSRIAGVLDERTRTMTTEIDLPNPDGLLLPGMFGQAIVVLEDAHDKIVLPSNVVRYDGVGKSYVYVVNASSQIEVIDVVTGWDNGQEIEIVSGLSGNELLVGPILGRLKAGQTVRVN